MYLKQLCLSIYAVGAISGVLALPSKARSEYAVKERHAVPLSWTNIGPASKSEKVHLQVGLKLRNEGVVEQHLLEVSDPKHARYGQHLSAEEIHDIVSPSEESVELVQAWLVEHGITNLAYSPSKDWVHIIVPIEKAEELLQTSYSTFQHWDGSTLNRAPEWSLPIHLHEHVDVVQPTTSFFRPKPEANKPLLGESTQTLAEWDQSHAAVLDVCFCAFGSIRWNTANFILYRLTAPMRHLPRFATFVSLLSPC